MTTSIFLIFVFLENVLIAFLVQHFIEFIDIVKLLLNHGKDFLSITVTAFVVIIFGVLMRMKFVLYDFEGKIISIL